MKRWMALLLAGLLVFPQAMVLRAEELIDGYAETDGVGHEEGILDNAIEEINSASDISEFTDVESEDLISVESPEECTEELCDEPKEVSANSSTPFITGFYNSTRGGDIRWSKVDGAAGYVLYRMRSADGLKKVATINNPDTLQYIDEGIKDNCWGLVYAYYVRPIINGKEGEKSDSVTLQRLAPMKITNVTQTSGTSVSLNWACSVNENKSYGYEVQYAEKNTDLYDRVGTFKAIPVEGRSNLSAAIGSLKSGKKYWIRVRCYVNYTHSVTGTLTKTWSQYSNIVTIKLASVSDTTPAYQVTDSVTNYRSGIWIYWTPTNARGYNVYRKTGADGQWQKIAYVAGQKAYRYHDAAVKDNNGVLYYYTVRGVIGSKLSDYDKNGRGIMRLVPPDFTKTENSSTGTVSLAWNKNNAATGYVIRYSKDKEMPEDNISTVTIPAKTTLTTEIKGLDVGATYYFNVRAYTVQGGDTYYGQWSSLSSVTVESSNNSGQTNTGTATHVISSYTDIDNSYKYTYTLSYRSDGQVGSVSYVMYNVKTNKAINSNNYSFTYDSKGNLTNIVGSNGGSRTLFYNSDGTINQIGEGRDATYLYYQNQILIYTDHRLGKEKYSYDSNGHLKQYMHTSGETTDFTWDSHYNRTGRVLIYRYTNPYTYVNTYSGNDLVKQIEYGSGVFVTNTYEYKYVSVNVPSSAKDKVERQQWAIRNGDYFYTLGGTGYDRLSW